MSKFNRDSSSDLNFTV